MSEDGDDAGSEEKFIVPQLSEKALLATGLTTLSVSPVAVARLKATIATVNP